MKPPPPMPDENGSVTPSTAAAATAASTALPPRRSTSSAAPVATLSTVAAAPPVPCAVGLRWCAGTAAARRPRPAWRARRRPRAARAGSAWHRCLPSWTRGSYPAQGRAGTRRMSARARRAADRAQPRDVGGVAARAPCSTASRPRPGASAAAAAGRAAAVALAVPVAAGLVLAVAPARRGCTSSTAVGGRAPRAPAARARSSCWRPGGVDVEQPAPSVDGFVSCAPGSVRSSCWAPVAGSMREQPAAARARDVAEQQPAEQRRAADLGRRGRLQQQPRLAAAERPRPQPVGARGVARAPGEHGVGQRDHAGPGRRDPVAPRRTSARVGDHGAVAVAPGDPAAAQRGMAARQRARCAPPRAAARRRSAAARRAARRRRSGRRRCPRAA